MERPDELSSNVVFVRPESGGVLQDSVGEDSSFENDLVIRLRRRQRRLAAAVDHDRRARLSLRRRRSRDPRRDGVTGRGREELFSALPQHSSAESPASATSNPARRQRDEVHAMLDRLDAGVQESPTQNQRPKRGLPREH